MDRAGLEAAHGWITQLEQVGARVRLNVSYGGSEKRDLNDVISERFKQKIKISKPMEETQAINQIGREVAGAVTGALHLKERMYHQQYHELMTVLRNHERLAGRELHRALDELDDRFKLKQELPASQYIEVRDKLRQYLSESNQLSAEQIAQKIVEAKSAYHQTLKREQQAPARAMKEGVTQ
jgi:hypothetical protein